MPPSPAADYNLLFGILALQMDFVSRDALIQAMNAWVLDKARPLGAVLAEQGALTAERQALLEALVREHLRLHDNDPEKSLAALSHPGTALEEHSRSADADVQASLAHLGPKPPDGADPCATRATTVGQP